MRITEVETIQVEEFPNLTYVRLHTDSGLVGLGETYFAASAVAAWIHESAAPVLLGADAGDITRIWGQLVGFVGSKGSGIENRGRSAVDIALWDLLGQETGKPIWALLGGRSRDSVPAYNTCAGYAYTRGRPEHGHLPVGNWGIGAKDGPYEDLQGFLHHADDLAEDLLSEGYMGMKIWPFDRFAEENGGHGISAAQLREGLEPFRKIRDRVGDRIEIMVEMHSLWDLPTAVKIARAVGEYEPHWFEDPMPLHNLDAVRRFREQVTAPVAVSETMGTRWAYQDLLQAEAADLVIFDPTYAGGISEARHICALADLHTLPVALHDCVGPVSMAVNTHLSVHAPNIAVQEVVRAFATDWYAELLTDLPAVEDGRVLPLDGPGLGTRLRDDVLTRPDVTRRSSRG
ncbi:mandelate racemase/muconate lactonizing enzyme family protein [Demetria terragena]|uniref:mandelate racemase/muconate lactonizing enzyme family protein n=1 Tax=Demetria terragena TaxID=63959 RepID=UPI0003A33AE3|nr:mandelate racemase/muconate lactonizing enzyme family protein [Demetria terragena]